MHARADECVTVQKKQPNKHKKYVDQWYTNDTNKLTKSTTKYENEHKYIIWIKKMHKKYNN